MDRRFTPEEMARIRQGLVPNAMEDKWFIYWQDNALTFHRSWTGACIYVVHFTCDDEGCRMVAVDVNRDPSQYTETNDDWDAEMVNVLIDSLLLHRTPPFPDDEAPSEAHPMRLWSWIGRAMFGQHPNDE